jgi:purine-binding chemotaxis protein CheW
MRGMSTTQIKTLQELAGKYLTFAVSKERYGIEILTIQEIIQVPQLTRVPKSPEHTKGVINLRGKIIPVIDLRGRFGLAEIPYNERTCIIVVHMKRGATTVPIGLVVDTVLEVLDFEPREIEPSPAYGTSFDSSSILGLGRKGNIVNILLDAQILLGVVADLAPEDPAELPH